MFTVFGYLNKRDDVSTQDFIDHYENRHVPLILSLAPAPPTYKRHYLKHADELNFQHTSLDFDAITELGFPDRAAFLAWISAVTTGDAGERVAEDEARFLNRSRTRSCVVEDRVTSD